MAQTEEKDPALPERTNQEPPRPNLLATSSAASDSRLPVALAASMATLSLASPESDKGRNAICEIGIDGADKNHDVQTFSCEELCTSAFQRIQEMREEDALCDVVLDVEGVLIHAHRLVLAASSSYFYSMFVRDMLESKQEKIKLQGVEPEAVQLLVEFSYTAKLKITTRNVQTLMTAASLFDFPAVFTATAEFLCKQLHPSNCLGIRLFAKTHGSAKLVDTATTFFRNNFLETQTLEDEFMNLSAEDLAFLLNSSDLNVGSEEDVYKAVQLWLKHSPQDRKDDLPILLQSIRLPLLSKTFLTSVVETDSNIKGCLKCRDLLDKAKNFHLMPEKYMHSTSEWYQPRKSTVGLLFAIGGRGAVGEPFNSVECYDFRTNTWREGPELKSRRRHVGVACLGDHIYAVGGHDGNQHLNSVERYDPVTGHWEYVQSMKKLRRGIAVGVLGGPLYAVGGLDDVNCYRAVERYDPDSDEWTEVASLQSPRGGVGVAALGRYLYAAGGNDGNSSLQTMERYDPHTNKWSEVASMAKRRAGVGLAALNGYLYAAGGFDDASPLDTVERYDPETNKWMFVEPMAVCRGGVGLAAMGRYLFAIGGHDGKNYLKTAEVYCPRTTKWSMVTSMETSRAGAGVVSCPLSTLPFHTTPRSASTFSIPDSLGSL